VCTKEAEDIIRNICLIRTDLSKSLFNETCCFRNTNAIAGNTLSFAFSQLLLHKSIDSSTNEGSVKVGHVPGQSGNRTIRRQTNSRSVKSRTGQLAD